MYYDKSSYYFIIQNVAFIDQLLYFSQLSGYLVPPVVLPWTLACLHAITWSNKGRHWKRNNIHDKSFQSSAGVKLMKSLALLWLAINSMTPDRFEWNFVLVIPQLILVLDGGGISFEIATALISRDFNDENSIPVLVVAWCRQATSL